MSGRIEEMNKNKILIGITGSIAAYKACILINLLKRNNFEIRVIMTEAATRFVAPLTFQTLSNFPVYIDMFKNINESKVEHIDLADWCNLIIVYPATYNTTNKIATGIADNLLTTILSAMPDKKPIIIAPAMNIHMWNNKIIKHNINNLKKINNYYFINPQKGNLACGYEAKGKVANPENVLRMIKKISEKNIKQ